MLELFLGVSENCCSVMIDIWFFLCKCPILYNTTLLLLHCSLILKCLGLVPVTLNWFVGRAKFPINIVSAIYKKCLSQCFVYISGAKMVHALEALSFLWIWRTCVTFAISAHGILLGKYFFLEIVTGVALLGLCESETLFGLLLHPQFTFMFTLNAKKKNVLNQRADGGRGLSVQWILAICIPLPESWEYWSPVSTQLSVCLTGAGRESVWSTLTEPREAVIEIRGGVTEWHKGLWSLLSESAAGADMRWRTFTITSNVLNNLVSPDSPRTRQMEHYWFMGWSK